MARDDEVRIIAFNIWQEEGCCDGRDVDHWLRAEVIWEEQQKQKQPASKSGETRVRQSTKKKIQPKAVKKP